MSGQPRAKPRTDISTVQPNHTLPITNPTLCFAWGKSKAILRTYALPTFRFCNPAVKTQAMAHFSMQFGRTTPGHTYKERPSVYGLCSNGDKVALVRIGAEHPYVYDLPGGGIESGESDAEAVVREFDEETGLTVWPSRQLGRAGQFWINRESPTNSLCTFFEVELTATDGVPSEPDHKLMWVPINEALTKVRHDAHAWAILQWAREKVLGARGRG
jgi:8-oxo-dGTP diphosphatase